MIPIRGFRWCAGVAAVLAAAGGVIGQNPPARAGSEPAASSPPGNRDEQAPTIEIAKKEFDAVRSLRDFGPDAKGGVPKLTMPALPGAGSPSASPVQTPGLKRPDSERPTSKNWLVDAMEKRPNEKSSRPGEERGPEKDRDSSDSRAARTRGNEEDERRNRNDSANPFSRFLGDWMTPQDLALLKPALNASNGMEGSGLGGALPSTGAGDAAFGASSESNIKALGANSRAGGRAQSTNQLRENPYLEVLGVMRPSVATPPVVTSSANNLAVTPSSASNMAPVFAPSPQPKPGQTPDFVRPNTDEKYFKQLKRF